MLTKRQYKMLVHLLDTPSFLSDLQKKFSEWGDENLDDVIDALEKKSYVFRINDDDQRFRVTGIGEAALTQHIRERNTYWVTVATFWVSMVSLVIALVSLLISLIALK